jgi:hypothetical protein
LTCPVCCPRRSGPEAARTILLFHIISPRPSKQPLMVRTFLKVYMELGCHSPQWQVMPSTRPVRAPRHRPRWSTTPCTRTSGTQWSGIHTRTALSTVHATLFAPCAAPTLLADVAVLLALLAVVHDGLRGPAHALTHHPVRSPCQLPITVLFAPRDSTRLAPCATPALLADTAVLLSLLVVVHGGRRRPAHAQLNCRPSALEVIAPTSL